MSRDWIKNLRNIEPYIPGEQSKDKNIVKIKSKDDKILHAVIELY